MTNVSEAELPLIFHAAPPCHARCLIQLHSNTLVNTAHHEPSNAKTSQLVIRFILKRGLNKI